MFISCNNICILNKSGELKLKKKNEMKYKVWLMKH